MWSLLPCNRKLLPSLVCVSRQVIPRGRPAEKCKERTTAAQHREMQRTFCCRCNLDVHDALQTMLRRYPQPGAVLSRGVLERDVHPPRAMLIESRRFRHLGAPQRYDAGGHLGDAVPHGLHSGEFRNPPGRRICAFSQCAVYGLAVIFLRTPQPRLPAQR
jgi:hypothetical protein